MKLSVIVPVYNVEEYVSKCIESIIEQHFGEYELELILVDDGSPDSSGGICDKYAAIDDRIRVIHQYNHGQAHARNRGIEIATGDYVAFLDSDDFWNADLIYDILKLIDFHKPDIALYSVDSFYSDGRREPFFRTPEGKVCQVCDGHELLLDILRNDYTFGWCPVFYIIKNCLIDEAGLFPEGLYCEDVVFSLNLWMNCSSVLITDSVLYSYRRDNSKSTTHIASFKYCRDLLTVIGINLSKIKQMNITSDLRDYLLLNHFSLIEVVLYFIDGYSDRERHVLSDTIINLKELYSFGGGGTK